MYKRKCLVTGGLGFIGRHVANELLRRGHDVLVYDISNTKVVFKQSSIVIINGDILDLQKLKKCMQDVQDVYHLSGMLGTSELFNDPHRAVDINIHGALNVLEAAIQMGVEKLFYPTKPNEWKNLYSATVQTVEHCCLAFQQAYGLDVRILKLWNVYGPHQKLYPVRKAVPMFIFQALHGLPLEVYGDGSQMVELLYVEEAGRVIIDYVHLPRVFNEPLEVGFGTKMTVNELAKAIIQLCDSSSRIVHVPMRRGEAFIQKFTYLDNITRYLDHFIPTPLHEGLKRTIKYYREISLDEVVQTKRFYYGNR